VDLFVEEVCQEEVSAEGIYGYKTLYIKSGSTSYPKNLGLESLFALSAGKHI